MDIDNELFESIETDKELAKALNDTLKPSQEKEVKIRRFQEEADESRLEWFNSLPENFVSIPSFESIKHFLKVLDTKNFTGLILYGRGGIGKSRLVLSYLKKEKINFVYNNSYTTPLSFAKFLYENRRGKVIVLDDVEGILKNKVIMSMLKSALDTKRKRLVYYNSTSDYVKQNLPSPFVFESSIVILLNSIPDNSEIESLFSRLIVKEVNLTYSQILNISNDILKLNHSELSDEEIKEVVEFIENNTSQATRDFNFRTIEKIISFYKYNREVWKELALEILENDEELEIIRRLMVKYPDNVMKQFVDFQKITGKSRATFFRKKKSLKVS